MEKLVKDLVRDGKETIRRSNLPPYELLDLHVNANEFMGIVNREKGYQLKIDKLAKAIHGFYMDLSKTKNKKVDYEEDFYQLSEEIQGDNISAAMRLPGLFTLLGLYIEPADSEKSAVSSAIVNKLIKDNIELLAREEHIGWMQRKIETKWSYSKVKDNDNKKHPCLVSYDALTEEDKDKDSNNIKKFPEIVKLAGYKIVKWQHKKL